MFDHIVNVVDGTEIGAFFFAQVKTTSAGYETRKDGKKYLKVQVSKQGLEAMFRYPGPAYLFGIDERSGSAYVVAVNRKREAGFSAMPTDFEVNCITLRKIWDEVKAHWADNPASFASRFSLK